MSTSQKFVVVSLCLLAVVGVGFAQKRKTILNNLKSYYPDASRLLEQIDIDSRRRAETFTLEEWSRLADTFKEEMARH